MRDLRHQGLTLPRREHTGNLNEVTVERVLFSLHTKGYLKYFSFNKQAVHHSDSNVNLCTVVPESYFVIVHNYFKRVFLFRLLCVVGKYFDSFFLLVLHLKTYLHE